MLAVDLPPDAELASENDTRPTGSVNRSYSPQVVQLLAVTERMVQDANRLLEGTKAKDVNYLGDDIDPETLAELHRVLTDPASHDGLDKYRVAQLRELGFWRWVAFEGYNELDPRVFPLYQNRFMTEMFLKTGWDARSLEQQSLVEIGCGPLGMIEFLPASRRVAFDPLNDHYNRLFSRIRSQSITYVTDLDELLRDAAGTFDLAICFNVLDHTNDPRGLFEQYMALLKPGGRFLFEVNTIAPNSRQSEEHRQMHPSPFTVGKITSWLSEYSRDYQQIVSNDPSPEKEYFFMSWGTKR
ncbi:MAG: class I SAM-dependent methyltransferase [Gemmataceae bacterium]